MQHLFIWIISLFKRMHYANWLAKAKKHSAIHHLLCVLQYVSNCLINKALVSGRVVEKMKCTQMFQYSRSEMCHGITHAGLIWGISV